MDRPCPHGNRTESPQSPPWWWGGVVTNFPPLLRTERFLGHRTLGATPGTVLSKSGWSWSFYPHGTTISHPRSGMREERGCLNKAPGCLINGDCFQRTRTSKLSERILWPERRLQGGSGRRRACPNDLICSSQDSKMISPAAQATRKGAFHALFLLHSS